MAIFGRAAITTSQAIRRWPLLRRNIHSKVSDPKVMRYIGFIYLGATGLGGFTYGSCRHYRMDYGKADATTVQRVYRGFVAALVAPIAVPMKIFAAGIEVFFD